MSEIRPFARGDAGAVAALFQKTFRSPGAAANPALEAYFVEAYLDHPWFDPEIAARVHVNDQGRVTGFVGVFPGRFTFEGRAIRAAIAGTLMVEAPEREPLAGAKLLRAVVKGPQDITLSETANPISQALWEPLRGSVAPLMSLDWFRPFQPMRAIVSLAAERHAAARALTPFARIGDALAGRVLKGSVAPPDAPKRVTVEHAPADADFAEAVHALSQNYALAPAWSAHDVAWFLAQASDKDRYGPVRRAIVRTAKGALAGCYLYHGDRGRIGRVLQVLAEPTQAGAVLDCLVREAHEAGLVALRGRLTPRLAEALLTRGCLYLHRASMIVHAADPALRSAALNDAPIVGLAGESWTRLVGHNFV